MIWNSLFTLANKMELCVDLFACAWGNCIFFELSLVLPTFCLLLKTFRYSWVAFAFLAHVLFHRCNFTRRTHNSSHMPDTSNPWTQHSQQNTRSTQQRKCVESILFRWQGSWSFTAWYWKVAPIIFHFSCYHTAVFLL